MLKVCYRVAKLATGLYLEPHESSTYARILFSSMRATCPQFIILDFNNTLTTSGGETNMTRKVVSCYIHIL